MNPRHALAATAMALAACTTSGPESPAPGMTTEQVPMASSPVTDKDELVCELRPVTGSRISARVCMTREDRDRLQDSAQNSLEEFKGQAAVAGAPQGQ